MKRQFFFIIAFFSAITLNAQNAVSCSGGEAVGSGGSSSFTVGQVFYTSVGNSFSNSQGVQQPFKILSDPASYKVGVIPQITVLVKDTSPINASIYPNPAINYIVLNIGNTILADLNYILYDLNGRAISTGIIQNKQTNISFPYLVTGAYTLQVIQHTKQLKSFIIIKK